MSKMEIVLVGFTTAATIAAAVAAWFSYNVSKQTLELQKKAATSQILHTQLLSIQGKLLKIRLNLDDIYGSSDEDFKSLEPMFNEVKKEIDILNYQTSVNEKILELLNYSDVAMLTDEILNSSIQATQNMLVEIWC